MLAGLNNLLVGFFSVQNDVIHFLICADELLTLLCSVHIDLICDSIDIFHQRLSLVEHVRTFVNLLCMEVHLIL